MDYFINGVCFGAGISTGVLTVIVLFSIYMQRRTARDYGPMRICPHCHEQIRV